MVPLDSTWFRIEAFLIALTLALPLAAHGLIADCRPWGLCSGVVLWAARVACGAVLYRTLIDLLSRRAWWPND